MASIFTDLDLRFAVQPVGGGPRNPAWDFAVVIRECQAEKRYTWSARAVYKPFVSMEDAEEEFDKWSG